MLQVHGSAFKSYARKKLSAQQSG